MNRVWNEIADEFAGKSMSDADKEADMMLKQRVNASNGHVIDLPRSTKKL